VTRRLKAATGARAPKRRKPGRPSASQKAPGRDGIVAAARRLLEQSPPHRVTNVMIAREAGVDPALVRYYFASRTELLFAVVENTISTWVAAHQPPDAAPAERLAAAIRGMVDFAHSARSLQRLMIEECAESKLPAIRQHVRELNSQGVASFAKCLGQDESDPLRPVDPLLLYISIIGMSEFFVAAQPMILPLLPGKPDAAELAERYKDFIVNLVLDGLKPRRAR
jgi:TetR/AcrR family transcriptional regulator